MCVYKVLTLLADVSGPKVIWTFVSQLTLLNQKHLNPYPELQHWISVNEHKEAAFKITHCVTARCLLIAQSSVFLFWDYPSRAALNSSMMQRKYEEKVSVWWAESMTWGCKVSPVWCGQGWPWSVAEVCWLALFWQRSEASPGPSQLWNRGHC